MSWILAYTIAKKKADWAQIKSKLETEGAKNKQYDSDIDGVIDNSDKVDGLDLPNTCANLLTDHDKATHDALGIDADKVDGIDLPNTISNVLTDHNRAAHDALGTGSVVYTNETQTLTGKTFGDTVKIQYGSAGTLRHGIIIADSDGTERFGLSVSSGDEYLIDLKESGKGLKIYNRADGVSGSLKCGNISCYNITPGDDNTYELGSTSLRWKNVYCTDIYSGDIHLDNGWTITELGDRGVVIKNADGEEIFRITEDVLWYKGDKIAGNGMVQEKTT